MGSGRRTAVMAPASRLAILVLLYMLVSWLTGWQTLNTAEGIDAVHLFGDRSFAWIVLFAAALQSTASVGFLLMPLFFAEAAASGVAGSLRRAFCALLVALTCIAILAFETLHVLVVQVMNSQGADMVTVETKELERLNAQISTVSASMADAHSARMKALETLADRSAKGLDGTGDARCGTICKGYHLKLSTLRQQFADLGELLAPVAAQPGGVRSLYIDVTQRSKLLRAQAGRHAEYYKAWEHAELPANVTMALSQIEESLGRKQAKYDKMTEINAKSLAVSTAFGLLGDALVLDFHAFSAPFILPVLYSVAPMMALMSLSVLIGVVRAQLRATESAEDLIERVENEQRVAELLERLEPLVKRSFRARLRADMWRGRNDCITSRDRSEGLTA